MQSKYSECITRNRHRQEEEPTTKQTPDNALLGDFEPDIRPFSWKPRKCSSIDTLSGVQLELFDTEQAEQEEDS